MAVTEWLTANLIWAWSIFGFILLIAEILLPGIFLVWFGAAAIATACIAQILGSLFPFIASWQGQICIFMLCSILLILKAHRYFSKGKKQKTEFINETVQSLLGQSFPLHTELQRNRGTICAHDTIWQVKGKDLPKGARVRLKKFEDGVFAVEAASDNS